MDSAYRSMFATKTAIRIAVVILVTTLVIPAARAAAGGASITPRGGAAVAHSSAAGREAAQQKLGIEVVALRLSEGGNVIDLRYKVLDPSKAHACLSSHARPYLQDPTTGAKLSVPDMPYVGALRQTAVEPLAGKTYFIIFWNPRRLIKEGRKLNLVVGNQTIPDLVINSGEAAPGAACGLRSSQTGKA